MKSKEITSSYKGKAIAKHWGGYNGRKIPDELKSFITKHVKKTPNGNYYINQYNDEWYWNVFGGANDISNFKSFMAKFTPYFLVQRVQQL